jgi:rubredoxin
MATDDHGSCKNCGFDLNGERVYDYFLREEGDPVSASAVASMYGCRKDYGRFGRAIYVKGYDENYNKLPPYWKCPECGKECY